MKTLLHVNACEGPGKLDELWDAAAKFGYDGVELRWKYAQPDMDQEAYRAKVVQLKDKYPGMTVNFGGVVNLTRCEPDKVREAQDEYLAFMEWAKAACDTPILNVFTGIMLRPDTPFAKFEVNGSACADEADYLQTAEALKPICDRAQELGMVIALEMHNGYIHDLAKSCRKLMDICKHPALGLNYDQGNIILNQNGEAVKEVFEILPDKIYYAHLKNAYVTGVHDTTDFAFCSLEEGQINTMDVMKGLKKYLKYDTFAIEFPGRGDGLYCAYKDMQYVKWLKNFLNID